MIYRFKVWFEEEEEIFRVIDIAPSASFLSLHQVVLDSIGFKKDLPSSFYCSDDNWRKGKEISLNESSKLLMETSKLKDHINDPHQKFIFITDFNENWILNIELQSIQNDVSGIAYPFVFKLSISLLKITGSITTPLPIKLRVLGLNTPDGMVFKTYFLPSNSKV